MLKIDTSQGLGSGQSVRIIASLATLSGKPLYLYNIRRYRQEPGLRLPHVEFLKILAQVCDANVEGLQQGSTTVVFQPSRPPQAGAYRLALHDHSCGLIQAIYLLIPLIVTRERSVLEIEGGLSYPCHHYQYVVQPLLAKMGVQTEPSYLLP